MTTTQSGNERIQNVVFLRHGVARHNLRDPVTGEGPDIEHPSLLDPPLVYQGKQQALAAGETLRTWFRTTQLGEDLELVITSPLTRCLQTSTLAMLPGDFYTSNGQKEPKFLCTEAVREAYGMHYPDKRREKSLLVKHWPMVEFDGHMKEDDEAWSPTKRETIHELRDRVLLFLQQLSTLPQSNILVVSHGVWIETCFRCFCPEALDHGRKRVYNCDLFAGKCSSRNGSFLRLHSVQHLQQG